MKTNQSKADKYRSLLVSLGAQFKEEAQEDNYRVSTSFTVTSSKSWDTSCLIIICFSRKASEYRNAGQSVSGIYINLKGETTNNLSKWDINYYAKELAKS